MNKRNVLLVWRFASVGDQQNNSDPCSKASDPIHSPNLFIGVKLCKKKNSDQTTEWALVTCGWPLNLLSLSLGSFPLAILIQNLWALLLFSAFFNLSKNKQKSYWSVQIHLCYYTHPFSCFILICLWSVYSSTGLFFSDHRIIVLSFSEACAAMFLCNWTISCVFCQNEAYL